MLGRPTVRLGIAAAIVAAVVMVVMVATKGQKSLFRNDAEFYWLVARDPFGDGAVFIPFQEEMGRAYRYGRILFPAIAWVLAAGQASIVPWTLMVVDVLAFGATVWLAAELCALRGRTHRGLAVLLVPAMWVALVIAVSEPLVFALILGTYLLWLRGQRAPALLVAAALLLAREAAAVALLPILWRDLRERGVRVLAGWALVPVPLLAWWVYVRARVGEWPFLDDSISRREALSPPLGGALTIVREGASGDHVVAFVLGALTIACAVWVARRFVWWPISQGALAYALLLLLLGPNAWRYPGEAIRLMGPAQILIVLAVAVSPPTARRRQPAPT